MVDHRALPGYIDPPDMRKPVIKAATTTRDTWGTIPLKEREPGEKRAWVEGYLAAIATCADLAERAGSDDALGAQAKGMAEAIRNKILERGSYFK